ncbi:ParA family protein [Tahibacter amnicola]|uniref:ParA family protein n=1 Tax=Tahibacter amnicola TaxID=2976241 RepID=A0ABY6BFI9_9GAMM|nr:ParA family protein [Tahibacter amnicola]UXI68023.1 ParA family protein [Tahibacter amnicola]
MFRILVANSKGGCGKTTLTSNLAGYFAAHQRRTALIDCDPQGSSRAWCEQRAAHLPRIEAIAGDDPAHGLRAGWLLRLTATTEVVVIDTPAGLRSHEFAQFVRHADVLLIPIVPSPIDLRATLQFLDMVRRTAEVRAGTLRVGLVANRVRERTTAARELEATLQRLTQVAVARLRDSQAYVSLASHGRSLFDETGSAWRGHHDDWAPLLEWLRLRQQERQRSPVVTPLVPLGARQAGTMS